MASFSEWYEKNGEAYNARRRAKYATNPEYREKAVQATRRRREKNKKPDEEVKEQCDDS